MKLGGNKIKTYKGAVVLLLLIFISTYSFASFAAKKKTKSTKSSSHIFEPSPGFEAFATQNEEKLNSHGYYARTGSASGTNTIVYAALGVEPKNVIVERDPDSGNVRMVTHVVENPKLQWATTNQINYAEGIQSHCTNMDKKAKRGDRVFRCSTVSREVCTDRSGKKNVDSVMVKHFGAMSSQLQHIKGISGTPARSIENFAEKKTMRNQLCTVLNRQPVHVLPAEEGPAMRAPASISGGGGGGSARSRSSSR